MMRTYVLDFSVIIPCVDEEKYISEMLGDVAGQSAFNTHSGEIIIVDGMSTDRTISRISEFRKTSNIHITVLENSKRHVADGLNAAISQAQGKFIIRMDVHARYPLSYIGALLSYIMVHSRCGNVGVPVRTLPADSSTKALAISAVLSHPFGVGNSSFRIGRLSQPHTTDTVPFGCFRAALFEEIGQFDVDLIRNQDDEMNYRIRREGYDVVLLPEPVVEYFGRGTYRKLWMMFYQYGLFKPWVAKKIGGVVTLRQLVPSVMLVGLCFLLVISVMVPMALYLYALVIGVYLVAGCFPARAAVPASCHGRCRGNIISLWLGCVAALAIVHLSYGIGYLRGLYFLSRRKRVTISSSR